MEKIVNWLKTLKPDWLKWLIAVLIALISMLFYLTSCSSPRTIAKVINRAESTSTEIHMTTGDGGSVTVTATPNIQLQLDPKKLK